VAVVAGSFEPRGIGVAQSARGERRSVKLSPHPFSFFTVLAAAKHDCFGTKDVQDAVTATYVWMADQIGHLTLGFVPTLLLCWLWSAVWQGWIEPCLTAPTCSVCGAVSYLGYFVAALLVWGVWVYKEIADYRDSVAKLKGIFPPDRSDLRHNVQAALLYFAIGGILAAAAFATAWAVLIALLVLIVPGIATAFWWLQRKVAFQQAGLPYLYRLANFPFPITPSELAAIGTVSGPPGETRDGHHIVIGGPIGTGKTSLAVGVGTEFAFSLGIGRYLSFIDLLELAGTPGGRDGAMEFDDGRVLWPWRDCSLLIIDDVNAGLNGGSTVMPESLPALLANLDQKQRDLMGKRRMVWVVGVSDKLGDWCQALSSFFGVPMDHVAAIDLTPDG